MIWVRSRQVLCGFRSGPVPYGVSSSWFFDQHFYVGLADDMDLGIRWSDTLGKLTLDVGYYLQSEPQTDRK